MLWVVLSARLEEASGATLSCQLGSVAQRTRIGPSSHTQDALTRRPRHGGVHAGALTSFITSHEPSAGHYAIARTTRALCLHARRITRRASTHHGVRLGHSTPSPSTKPWASSRMGKSSTHTRLPRSPAAGTTATIQPAAMAARFATSFCGAASLNRTPTRDIRGRVTQGPRVRCRLGFNRPRALAP